MAKTISERIKKLIDKSDNILIVSHENPDGDAIGSSIALARFLQLSGKEVVIWMPGRFPDYYKWMKGADEILYYNGNKSNMLEDLNKTDCLIAVDLSSLSRTGKMNEVLKSYNGSKVLFDHHIDPDKEYFDLVLSDVTVSSTSELIYHFISLIGMENYIDDVISEALYVGIMTDTGSFSFNCNSPVTYEIVAKLIHKGISPDRIHKLVYDNNSESRIRMLGYSLQKMKYLPDYHTAYIALDREELRMLKSNPGDTEGIVNFALSIKGVVLAAFFSIREGEVKISFRSKGNFSVNDFAREHFNGGGHRNAAGGSYPDSVLKAVVHFESLLPLYKNELNNNDEGF